MLCLEEWDLIQVTFGADAELDDSWASSAQASWK